MKRILTSITATTPLALPLLAAGPADAYRAQGGPPIAFNADG
jgi:hypothetical protein